MLLISGGNLESVAHARRKKIRFVIALDLINCLKQIKRQRSLLKRAPVSEIPSYRSTIVILLYGRNPEITEISKFEMFT